MAIDQLQQLGIVVRLGFLMVVGLLGYLFIWKSILVEEFRQEVFHIRRQVFLLVADGRLSANDKAYRRFMKVCNGTLRFAERVTLGRLMLAIMSAPREELKRKTGLLKAISRVEDDATKRELLALHDCLGHSLIRHVMKATVGGRVLNIIGHVVSITTWAIRLKRSAEREAVSSDSDRDDDDVVFAV